MRNFARIIVCSAVLSLYFMVGTHPVSAEGLSVSSDKEGYETGEKAVITIDASSVGDGTVPADVSVEFDARRLNFENCSVEYGGGGGGLVTFKDKSATVEFTTLSGGDATVNVTATAEDAAEPETASVTLSVSGEDTVGSSEEGSTLSGVGEGTIDLGDGRVVQAVFAEEFKPILFHKDTAEFKGQTVECAKFDMGDMTLLYTTDQSGADGKFMILNGSTGELDDFRMIQGIENRFIIVLSECEGPIPTGYTKAVLEWNGQTLTAYMEESVAQGTATVENGIDPADFFLVYALSSEGNKGWYRYDKNEGTYQRYMIPGEAASENEEDDVDTTEGSSGVLFDDLIPAKVQSILFLVCAPLSLILIIIVTVLAVRLRDANDELDMMYGEGPYYGDEEDEEDEEPQRPRGVTAASLVGRHMSEEDEEDEDDDEEEDDDEDDDETEEDDEDDDEDDEDEEDDDGEDDEEDEDDEDDEDDDDRYSRPLTRREQRELAREEKWRLKEEKKAAKRRAKGYEEATPMDWSTFGKEALGKDTDDGEDEEAYSKPKKEPLPPRKKRVVPEETAKPQVMVEEEQRQKQRRLFEQQQRIEEQRRIESEMEEAERQKEQQQFIASQNEEMELDEDFQFEFLNL